MAVKNGERVLVLTYHETSDVGRVISDAAEETSRGNVKLFILEDYTERPMKELPREILDAIPWLTSHITPLKASSAN